MLAWVSVLAALTGDTIVLPVLGTNIYMSAGLRLQAGNHPNICACMFLVAMMLGAWLVVHAKRRWLVAPVGLASLGAYLAVALTASRTVMLQLGCFAAVLVLIIILRSLKAAMWKKVLLGVLAGTVCLVLVFVSFDWAAEGINAMANRMTAHAESAASTKVVAHRSILRDLATMTGRTAHYRDVLKMISQRPKILLTGMLNSDIVQALMESAGVEHTHNSFLQTLVNMGIPGLLMALFFTVRAVTVSFRLIFSARARFADQMLAGILLTFLISTIPEPYLFTEYLTIANMPFFLVFGYALEAERALRE